MDFNILQCRRFVVPSQTPSAKRVVHHYEIDFHIKGARTMVVDGAPFEIADGSICVRRPGQVAYGAGHFDCYLLTLDFSKTAPTENYLRNANHTIEPPADNPLLDELPTAFVPQHRSEIHSLFARLVNQPMLNAPASHLLVNELLHLLNADSYHRRYAESKHTLSPAETVAQYIGEHFNEPLSLDLLAASVHLDKAYLVRLFKKQYSVTPIEYLITQRLHHAGMLLTNTTMSVEAIAQACGYSTTSFFIRQFKQHVHITPLQYRTRG